ATNAIEAIVVGYKKKDFKFEEFLEVLSKMSNLRLMIIDKVKLSSWSQPLSQWCPYDERGILVEFKILFHFLQLTIVVFWVQLQGLLCRKTVYGTSFKREEDGSRTEFLIIFQSCLIQTVRNTISIELPSNWYNSKWIGFALWASQSNYICLSDVIRARVIALGDMPQNHWAFELFTTLIRFENGIFLLYLSHDDWSATVGNGKCSQIKVIFETDKKTIDVFDCGVSLIYEQDVEEFNLTNAQCLIASFGEIKILSVSVIKISIDDVQLSLLLLDGIQAILSAYQANVETDAILEHIICCILKGPLNWMTDVETGSIV
ncbi:hypothetical protein CFP56_035410, partial [Quercus suber]